ncbi:MAG: PEGA domain-containing protein [Deltaproteobacteria bacterium]|nr:PEGA domain-containing protein [Deltaproteobacteria bacterium]
MPEIRSRVRPWRTGALWGLSLGLYFMAPVAHAEQGVAVLGVEPVGVPAPVAARFSAALKEHIQRTTGYRLVPSKALEEIKLVFGCINESSNCMSKVGKTLNAGLLLWGRVEKRKQGGLTLTLRLLDVRKKRIRKKLKQVFTDREAAAPEARVLALAAKLTPSQTATLRLRCHAEGAQVLIDGRAAGLVDAQGVLVLPKISLGLHSIQVRGSGFRPFTQMVALKAGQTLDLQVKLVAKVPEPEVTPPGITTPDLTPETPPEGSSIWKITFYSSLAATVGLGVGLVVNGLKVWSLEDDKVAVIDGLNLTNEQRAEGCALAGDGLYSDLGDICDQGKDHEIIQNVLIGVTAAVAALTGFAAYKTFLSSGSTETEEDEEARSKGTRLSRWHLTPALGPQGASLGLSVTF